MSETITLELPNSILQKAREIASLNDRTVEEILLEWINLASQEISPELLSNDQILALTQLQMPQDQQDLFRELQIRQRENQLTDLECFQLNELMQIYRKGLIRKAQALKIAVQRGLISTVNHPL